jgi:hypothetical protein
LKTAVLLLGLASALPAQPALIAHIHAYHPACAQAQPEAVAQALSQAAQLLAPCGISLSLTAWTELPREHALCHLPADRAQRRAALQRAATRLKTKDPHSLALFLLPGDADERLSWATVDVSVRSACDSPQEPRFLPSFGKFFMTDLAWSQRAPLGETQPTAPAFLMAHELLHSLSQRGHPSGAPRGALLADHIADIGPAVDPGLCACARKSPYLFPSRP